MQSAAKEGTTRYFEADSKVRVVEGPIRPIGQRLH